MPELSGTGLRADGYTRDMTLDGLMENKPQLIWASHCVCALAQALMDDAELGMMC